MSNKKSPPRKLLPVGDLSALGREQRQRVAAYAIASRLIPSGNRTAHNVQVLADWIRGEEGRR